MPDTIRSEDLGQGVRLLTLARPESLNAINTALARDLVDIFQPYVMTSETKDRVIILTGEGSRAFCAGADLKERAGFDERQWLEQHVVFEQAGELMSRCPLPVLAAVDGVAFGGGLELALLADFMFASTRARFAFPEATLGIIPGVGGTQRLPRRIGPGRAKELLYTGRVLTAAEAEAWGLVNRVLSPEELLPETIHAAREIARRSPFSMRQLKKAVDLGTEVALPVALRFEIEAYNAAVHSSDRVEGLRAFLEKRAPEFSSHGN